MGTHYSHLRLEERRKLANWLEAKMPISEIADRLGRAPCTIYRDIKRNRYMDDELPKSEFISGEGMFSSALQRLDSDQTE